MTLTGLSSSVAESYIRMLMITLSQHFQSERAVRSSAPRRGRLISSYAAFPAAQVRAQLTLTRLVAITESFTSRQLISRLEQIVPQPRSAFLDELYVKEERASTGGWVQMKDRYKKSVGGIDLSACGEYDKIKALVDVRNAIAHGLGTLTKQQLNDRDLPNMKARMLQIGVTVDSGNLVILGDLTLKHSAVVCKVFISELDLKLQGIPSP